MKTASGTTPPGTSGEQQAARWVERMFAEVAPRYDLLNHVLSFNIDRGWRKTLIRCLSPVLERPGANVLDLCCGTGDVLIDMESISKGHVMGADFCHPMLMAAQRKLEQKNFRAPLFEADALGLPLDENSLDAISIAFGYRNLANYAAALQEFRRVLKPAGMLAILEFSHPSGVLMKTAYGFYSGIILPLIGAALSGSRKAYTYLPDSIRKFPAAEELLNMLEGAGFENTTYQMLSGGIAALHVGYKSAPAGGRGG